MKELSWEYLTGHVIDVLKKLPRKSVHCVVTSPPYFGLRDYGIQPVIWGGKKGCRHKWGEDIIKEKSGGTNDTAGYKVGNNIDDKIHFKNKSNFCKKCGAWKGQLGLEPTLDMFVQNLVEIFREVREVLRDDGVAWINMGDSYVTNPAGNKVPSGLQQTGSGGKAGAYVQHWASDNYGQEKDYGNLKQMDLMMIPARMAIALQDDGWYVRSDVIWSKPNPMPESVNGWRWVRHKIKIKSGYDEDNPHPSKTTKDGKTKSRMKNSGGVFEAQAVWEDCPGCEKCQDNDGHILRKGSWRPTKAHEYIFMLTKNDEYFGNAEAVREPLKQESKERAMRGSSKDNKYAAGTERPPGVHANSMSQPREYLGYDEMEEIIARGETSLNPAGRNKRSVWSMVAKGFPGAHFATFPEELPRYCILASTSHRACPQCRAPWAPLINYKSNYTQREESHNPGDEHGKVDSTGWEEPTNELVGYMPTCDCENNDGSGVCTVLDPFAGSFTTGKVARELGRSAIGIDISKEYKKIAEKRARLNEKALFSYDEE